jgi:hypothetical protein
MSMLCKIRCGIQRIAAIAVIAGLLLLLFSGNVSHHGAVDIVVLFLPLLLFGAVVVTASQWRIARGEQTVASWTTFFPSRFQRPPPSSIA